MAGVYGATAIAAAATPSSFSPETSAAPVPRNSLVRASSLPSSFPSRGRRTNHLRKKILKTLENKPYPDISHLERKTSTISIEETVQQQSTESDQFSLSQTTGFVDEIVSNFSTKSFVKIGLYLVGAFIFQTVCAVLIFGSKDIDDEDENSNSDNHRIKKSRVSDLGVNGNNEWKSNSSLSGNQNLMETKEGGMVLVDESEIDKQIMEIKEMAREARQQEKLDAKRKGLVEEGDDHDLISKTMKEKEVDSRLMKLRKSLEGDYEKLPPKHQRKEIDKGNSAAGDAFGSLMFKKKYKYKSPSIDSGDKPKGFDGQKDDLVADGSEISEQTDLRNDNGSEISVTRDANKEEQPIDESVPVSELINKSESIAGTSKQTGRAAKSGKSSNLETRKPRGFGKESQSDNAALDDHNSNGGLKGKKGGNRKSAKSMKSNTHSDFWWTSLPYVLAVLMQRGGGNGEESGLFTLRSTSQSKSGLSHTVAFEDRGDATNFSYLLESFFESLGDFSTSIIPIPTNELEEAVKSEIMKVVVVKKGQLQLYIGQPLTDVESALRTLIEQSEKS